MKGKAGTPDQVRITKSLQKVQGRQVEGSVWWKGDANLLHEEQMAGERQQRHLCMASSTLFWRKINPFMHVNTFA